MKLSTSWAKDWLCRTISDDQMVAALERAGLEVEQFISSKPIDKKVIVALVKKVIQHPGADRLRLVDVTTGEREVRVVCGAPNVREGLKVALAQIGTTLPSGDVISAAKLRGEVSEGMLCSELELGLGNDHEGILELPEDAEVGTSLCDMYPSDGIVDMKTHANRFDLLSVAGLAREIAAMTDEKMKELPEPIAAGVADDYVTKELSRTARFMLVDMRLEAGALSPEWMTARLRMAGVRTISPIVDITNYVNLELGQPLHAYDAAKVKLPLEVRQARAGERLVTLDGVDRKLTEQDLVVADVTGPIGLAGLMGGAGTEVDSGTREILLEAATFDAATVRKMAKRHGLRTEASARFERGLPMELPPIALARAVALLKELTKAEVVTAADRRAEKPAERGGIDLPMELLNRLLGFEVTAAEAVQALARLQLEARVADNGQTISVPALPWWRPDLKEAQDLIEEIVRVLGLERVPSTLPQWRPQRLEFDRFRPRQRQLQSVLYGAGLFEVMTYSFVSEEQLTGLGLPTSEHLKLKNPLSTEQAYLRSSLLPSHLMVLNRNRSYAKELGFYELSKVFVKRGRGEQPDEPLRLAVTLMRPEEAYRHVKGVLDLVARELGVKLTVEPASSLPGFAANRGALVKLDDREIGCIGQLDPELLMRQKLGGEVAYLELDADEMLTAAQTRQFAGLERFPHTGRDLSVLVPVQTTWQDVMAVLEDLPNTSVNFVSDYYGDELPDGRKSLTLRLIVSHPDRTPTEAEAAEVEMKAMAILKRKFGAEQRT